LFKNEDELKSDIRLSVWSGMQPPDYVLNRLADCYEIDANDERFQDLVFGEFYRKEQAEETWPSVTDCDRLQQAFEALNGAGVIAIHEAGWDMGGAFHNCREVYQEHPNKAEMFGVCYYTSQDISSAIDCQSLYLGFGSTRPEDEAVDSPRAAEAIKAELEKVGLKVEWNGDTTRRIKVAIEWLWRNWTSPS